MTPMPEEVVLVPISSPHKAFVELLRKEFSNYEWFTKLEPRGQLEVIFANIYMQGLAHGTSGHLGYGVIDALSQELCRYEDAKKKG